MRYLLLAAIFYCLNISAQQDSSFYYSEVVQVEGVSKTDLYKRAEVWFSKTFNDMNAVIELRDQEAGHIFGDASFSARVRGANKPNDFLVEFKIAVFVKDGRFKYELKDFFMVDREPLTVDITAGDLNHDKPDCGNLMIPKKDWIKIKELTHETALLIVDSLVEAIQVTTETQDENW